MADALLKDKCSFVLQRNENIGFVLPVYGWDLPPIVRQFISQMELQEQTEKIQGRLLWEIVLWEYMEKIAQE